MTTDCSALDSELLPLSLQHLSLQACKLPRTQLAETLPLPSFQVLDYPNTGAVVSSLCPVLRYLALALPNVTFGTIHIILRLFLFPLLLDSTAEQLAELVTLSLERLVGTGEAEEARLLTFHPGQQQEVFWASFYQSHWPSQCIQV